MYKIFNILDVKEYYTKEGTVDVTTKTYVVRPIILNTSAIVSVTEDILYDSILKRAQFIFKKDLWDFKLGTEYPCFRVSYNNEVHYVPKGGISFEDFRDTLK